MYLKSIDLFGFKTFADRTRLEFQPGISGIVGPNGSGKSNFVDAVRWVLGEQSARQLRGARMDDVIFAGNTSRRPLGMAEVTLTFDNSDGAVATPFSEIGVTRRAYRNGESEFFLNKTQVRLRDITDLLLGTGLAAELAAIVSQGEIDAILSAKPEQRRELFEGVAGTSRYRLRKREAQRRLDQTAANALRINDLLIELEKQLPAIEQQVRRAKRYQRASQQARDLEILSYLRKTESRRDERATIAAHLGADETQADSVAAKQRELQAALNKARYDEYQATLELDECNAAHAKAASVLQEHAAAHAAAEAKSTELGRRCEALEAEVDAAARAETAADARLAGAQDDLRGSRERRDETLALAESAAAAEAQGTARWESAYAALRSAEDKRAQIAARAAESAASAQSATMALQRSDDAHARLRKERDETLRALEEQRRREAEGKHAADACGRRATEFAAETSTLEDTVRACRARRAASVAERDSQQAAHAHADARLASLKERLSQEHSAVNAAAVLDAAQRQGKIAGVIGRLAEQVTIASESIAALDALMAEHADDILVRDRKAARTAVELLRAAGLPRVTLVVVDDLPAKVPSFDVPAQPAIVSARSVVKCETVIQPVVDLLLNGAYLVPDLEMALSLAQRHGGAAFATRQGDVARDFRITTGAGRGPLVLHAQAQELERERDRLAAAVAERVRDLRTVDTAIEEAERKLKAAVDSRTKALIDERDALAAQERALGEIGRLQQRSQALQRQLEEAAADRQALEQQTGEHRGRADALQRDVDTLEQTRQQALAHAESVAQELNTLRSTHRSAAANAAALVERVAQLSDDVDSARAALASAQEARKGRIAALQAARSERETTAKDAASLSKLAADARVEVGKVEQALANARAQRDARAQKTRELDSAYEQAQQSGREQSLELERLRIRLAEIDAELSVLQQTFAQNPASAEECDQVAQRYRDYEGDADADVRRLRDELLRLGNVNLNALEDRSAALERCEFLKTQLRDLEAARTEILQSIAEMDAESLRQFNATFERVAVAFSETFTRLFNGGSAKIWVADAPDPTEAGIEISAQPPGKKMQHLNLLSGGERALTAVALIFATLQVRPSPFYIFDEIDAALDEANIGRFGGQLNELADRSQIIIITHNKATMTLMDRIYGITMGEPGVSNVLSLALEQAGAAG